MGQLLLHLWHVFLTPLRCFAQAHDYVNNKTTMYRFRNVMSLVVFVAVCAAIFFFAQRYAMSVTGLAKGALNREPQPYSEIYLANHLALPKALSLDASNIFSFVIRNNEYTLVTYMYEVTAIEKEVIRVLDTGQVTLQHGQSAEIQQPLVMGEAFDGKIEVSIKNMDLRVHFFAQT